MAKWMIHMSDGKTLTDADCFPHEDKIMGNLGYSPDNITSVERVVGGRTLTILKSTYVDTFFVASEASRDWSFGGAALPTEMQKQWIGCYLKDSDPPIQCNLIMNAKSFDVTLDCYEVKAKTKKGINAKKLGAEDAIRESYTKQFVDNAYSILKSASVDRVFSTPTGLGCLFKKPKVRAELVIRSRGVLLGFTSPDEKLKLAG